MSTIIKAMDNVALLKIARGWDRTYWAFDIHSTIIRPNYSVDEIPTELYDNALEVLRMLTADPEVCLMLYTCSHPHEIEKYLEYFKSIGVEFTYVNENPEVITQPYGYGCYTKKPYFNILFEDKAGFDAEVDWEIILNYLNIKKETACLK